MLLRNLFLKSLRDQRRGLLWWAGGLALLAWMMAAFYPSISFNPAIQDYIEAFPRDMLAFLGVSELIDFTSAAGYLNAEVFGLMAPILFIVFAVGLGASSIAGEEEKGTMEMLLAEPVTRGRLVLDKFMAMLVASLCLALAFWVALIIGALVVEMEISLLRLGEASISVTLLGLVFGALAFAVGCLTGRRGSSLGVAAGVAALTYLLNGLRGIVEFLEPVKWVSPFFYYSEEPVLLNGLNTGYSAVLVGIVALLAIVSYVGFERRDLRLQ